MLDYIIGLGTAVGRLRAAVVLVWKPPELQAWDCKAMIKLGCGLITGFVHWGTL